MRRIPESHCIQVYDDRRFPRDSPVDWMGFAKHNTEAWPGERLEFGFGFESVIRPALESRLIFSFAIEACWP